MTALPNHILEKMDPVDRAKMGKAGVTKAEAEAKFIAKTERDLQRLIANELLRREIWYWTAATNKRSTGPVGTPDFLFAINGQACAVEVKFGPGRLSKDQMRVIEEMKANGWRVAVVYSFQEFREFLEQRPKITVSQHDPFSQEVSK